MNRLPQTPIVYLAGGMKGTWQDTVMDAVKGPLYIDPRNHGLGSEAEYTAWDLTGVARCDILFAYMEKDNPSGYGLCLEVGVAAALGKHVIFVEDEGFDRSRYFGMVRQVSAQLTVGLPYGVIALRAAVCRHAQ